jgi:hypothetical protein
MTTLIPDRAAVNGLGAGAFSFFTPPATGIEHAMIHLK